MRLPPDIVDVDAVEQMIDTVGVGVAMYGPDGRFQYVNQTYAEMLEAEKDSLIGATVWDVNPAFDAERFEDYWDSLSPGESRYAEAIHEYTGTRVHVSTVTTETAIGGSTVHIGTVQDISHRKERERQLEGLHVVTSNLMAADSRAEIADITARTAESILGFDCSVVWLREGDHVRPVSSSAGVAHSVDNHPVYTVDGDSPVASAYQADEPVTVSDAASLDGTVENGDVESLTYVPIGDRGVFGVTVPESDTFDQTDVYITSILGTHAATALNRLADERDLERQNERFEAFYDVISHDIPNHLNVAQTRAQLADQQEDFDQLVHVQTAHDRIGTVIDDMQTLVEQGRHVDELEAVTLSAVASRCWDTSRCDGSEASLVVEDDASIRASRSRLQQLLDNLFWNAFDHGGADVTVRIGTTSEGFYVEDDGPGIPDGEREDVLSPGYSTATDHSGFGLAIVREIARAHDWTVAVEEGSDGGARFAFAGVQFVSGPAVNDMAF